MQPWLERLRIVAITAAVTSGAWLIGGGVWVWHQREQWQAEALSQARSQAREGQLRRAVRAIAPRPARPAGTLRDRPVADVAGGAAVSAVAGSLTIPVAGVGPGDLVDTFRQSRAGGSRAHDAIDIMAASGTPVLASAAGRVEKLFVSADGGNTIYLRSPDRMTVYYYAHLDRYAPGLAEGQAVRAGQVLGTVGATGNADPAAPHLHFAILRTRPEAKWSDRAVAINPYPLLAAAGRAH